MATSQRTMITCLLSVRVRGRGCVGVVVVVDVGGNRTGSERSEIKAKLGYNERIRSFLDTAS
jgi:hypothetical protein